MSPAVQVLIDRASERFFFGLYCFEAVQNCVHVGFCLHARNTRYEVCADSFRGFSSFVL